VGALALETRMVCGKSLENLAWRERIAFPSGG
jgi:hypothetical protein